MLAAIIPSIYYTTIFAGKCGRSISQLPFVLDHVFQKSRIPNMKHELQAVELGVAFVAIVSLAAFYLRMQRLVRYC